MLYGIEEFEDEFGLIKKQKLNTKKVIIVVTIAIIVIVIVSCFFITKLNGKNKENKIANANENTIEIEENSETSSFAIGEKNNNQQITENHIQIATHSMEKINKSFLPVFNENGYNMIKDIYKSEEKQVYLTFDDGPSKNITPKILDILKENDVKATFFALGYRIEQNPDILRREFNEGHYIANHGYSHEYSKVYQSKDTVFQEYIDCENCIKNALNNQDYNSYLFRFPGGSSGGRYEKVKSQARQMFQEYGYAYTNWNCLTGDAANKNTKEECIQEMLDTLGNQKSIILLMHDSSDKQQTVDALPDIIQYFKNEGYTFKNFYEIFK